MTHQEKKREKIEDEDEPYNAFEGFPNEDDSIEAFEENKSDFIKLMKWLFAEDKVFEYVKSWISHIIQKPEVKTKVALVIFSKTHGTGKNSFIDGIVAIIGKLLCGTVESIEDITKNFNAHLCNKLFIYGDEISANAKKVADRLKQVITRPTQNLEKKHMDATEVDDFTNWAFTTNNENCFKNEEGDRRLMMIHAKEDKQTEISKASYAELEDPEKLKKLFKFFKNYKQSEESIKKYKEFNIGSSEVIETEYKKQMTYENRPSYIQMLYKNTNDFVGKVFQSTTLYEEALKYAKKHFLSSHFTGQEMSKSIKNYLKEFFKKGMTCNKYIFPKTRTELSKILFEVDEPYYRYINQLEDDFIPDWTPKEDKTDFYNNIIEEE